MAGYPLGIRDVAEEYTVGKGLLIPNLLSVLEEYGHRINPYQVLHTSLGIRAFFANYPGKPDR